MRYPIVVAFVTVSECLYGQVKSSVELKYTVPDFTIHKKPISQFRDAQRCILTPVILFGVGLYATPDNDIINKIEFKEERDEYTPTFRRRDDDYLQYATIAAVYGLNAWGIHGKNNFGNRTALLVKSEIIMATLTYSLKRITAVPRPDTGQPTSFPSGHTAQAFAAATFMVKEYGNQNIWYLKSF